MKKLLVIDGNSILNRAFYGVRPLTTSSGKNTNAVFGMIRILRARLEQLAPDYAAVAFDLHAPTFRKKAYEAYKGTRKPTPPELLEQFDDAKECLRAMGLTVLEKEGYEADDIQGTLATLAAATPDTEAYILSGDRDLLQLIDDRISVLLVGNRETLCYDRDAFFAKYGVEPHELIDVKALMGDSSDNIPGVGGVGEKTAFKLIADFKSLDAVYENIDSPQIAKGVREKLLRDREQAYLSRFLATIEVAVPLELSLADLAYKGIQNDALYRKFTELEFTDFIQRFRLTPPREETVTAAAVCYRETDAATLFSLPADRPIAISLEEEGVYLATEDEELVFRDELSDLAPFFATHPQLVCLDSKALCRRLLSAGITPAAPPFDLLLAAYVLNPGSGQPTLASLTQAELGLLPPTDTSPVSLFLPLAAALKKRVEEAGALSLLEEIELPLAPILAEMEQVGFRVDTEGLLAFDKALEKAIDADAALIAEMAGVTFNINSPKQLGEVLFERLNLPCKKRTKSGYSTDADVLNELRLYHPIVDAILEYRQLTKLRSTYAVGLVKAADEKGRIHTDFKQALTATGRLSSAEPNLQNIPIRTELGRQFRRYFIPSDADHVLIDADYSQIELRLLAHMSGDPTMIEAYRQGADIHTRTASAAFGVPEELVTPELRKQAKAVSFGIIYGISAFSLAADLGITVKEAKQYIEAYFEQFPSVKGYLDGVIATAKEKGYTETLFGRRRYLPELAAANFNTRKFGERAAMNSPLQGTAADIIKIAMVNTARRLKKECPGAFLVMQVHDELILESRRDCADTAAAILREEMENAAALSLPLTVDITVGETWLG